MKAEIRSIDLIDYDNWAYWPDDTDDFYVAAEALIGPKDSEGAEIFSFEICSPKWFSRHRANSAIFVRHMIFMNEYDEQAVKNAVVELVKNASGDTWTEVAEKLSRYMFWEFEDYQPYVGS